MHQREDVEIVDQQRINHWPLAAEKPYNVLTTYQPDVSDRSVRLVILCGDFVRQPNLSIKSGLGKSHECQTAIASKSQKHWDACRIC